MTTSNATEANASAGPLAGIRVVAMEHMAAMPFATQLLARLGADVIKIEPPGNGESGRASQPNGIDRFGRPLGATFTRSNGLKRSLALNAKHPAGRELLERLLDRVDVFAENFPPQTLTRLGLGPRQLLAGHPRLIYASISGFGHTAGPYRERPAYAAIVEAMSGIYEWKRRPDAPPRANPVGALGDISAGLFAAVGILSALRERDRSGVGQHVDVAMFDAAIAMTDVVANFASLGVPDEAALGTGLIESFRAADGYFVVQVVREHHFRELVDAIGHPEWADDERFSTRAKWVEQLESTIRPAVEAWASAMTRVEVADALSARGLACGPSLTSAELLGDPGVAARGSLVTMTTRGPESEAASHGDGESHDEAVAVAPGVAFKLDTWTESPSQRLPSLGEDTNEILRTELGLDRETLAALKADGVLGRLPDEPPGSGEGERA